MCHIPAISNQTINVMFLASCGPPPVVENAVAVSSGETYQNTVSYMCLSGLSLVGSHNITCQPNATWSLPTPACEGNNEQLVTQCQLYKLVSISGSVFHSFPFCVNKCTTTNSPRGLPEGKRLFEWKGAGTQSDQRACS